MEPLRRPSAIRQEWLLKKRGKKKRAFGRAGGEKTGTKLLAMQKD